MIDVTISGTAFGAIEAGGLLQQERPHIAAAFTWRKIGYGQQGRASLDREDAAALLETLQAYGEMFSDRSAFDSDDEYTHREGLACLRDAARLRKELA